jgi:hypothetical protein
LGKIGHRTVLAIERWCDSGRAPNRGGKNESLGPHIKIGRRHKSFLTPSTPHRSTHRRARAAPSPTSAVSYLPVRVSRARGLATRL